MLSKVFAPVMTGFIMAWVSIFASAIVIALWNVVSMGVEYLIMRKIYDIVPELQTKKG